MLFIAHTVSEVRQTWELSWISFHIFHACVGNFHCEVIKPGRNFQVRRNFSNKNFFLFFPFGPRVWKKMCVKFTHNCVRRYDDMAIEKTDNRRGWEKKCQLENFPLRKYFFCYIEQDPFNRITRKSEVSHICSFENDLFAIATKKFILVSLYSTCYLNNIFKREKRIIFVLCFVSWESARG